MDQFEYIATLISFLVAIGVAEVAAHWAKLLRSDHKHLDLLHTGAAGLLVLLLVQFWWGFWNFRHVDEWSFAMLLSVLLPVGCIVLAGLVLSPSDLEPPDDLRGYYMRQRRVVYPLAALTFFGFAVADALISKQPVLHPENAVRLLAILLCGLAAWSSSERIHRIAIISAYVLLVAFVLVAIEL